MLRFPLGLVFAGVVLAVGSVQAFGQEIVSDPALNQRLVTFEQSFSQLVAEHPELTSGATQPISLDGKKGKVSFAYTMQGEYTVHYGTLEFSATSPISPNRFEMRLDIDSISLEGSSALAITKGNKTYNLNCPDNEVSVNAIVYTSEVEVTAEGAVLISNPQVDIDRQSVAVSVPCLHPPATEERADGTDALSEAEVHALFESEIAPALAESVAVTMAPPGRLPSRGTLNKVNSGLQTSAGQPDSDVTNEASATAGTSGSSLAASAGSPCGGAVNADAQSVVADLAAISAQAQAQGFSEAISAFAVDLRLILPMLSAPAQATVQTFLDDLSSATSASGPGGTTITAAEQLRLTNDLFSVVLSTGISTANLVTIQTDLNVVLSTLGGISTAQLQADLQKLVQDVRGCLA